MKSKKKKGLIKYTPQYREFPPNVMEGGGLLGDDPTKPYHSVNNPDGYRNPIYVNDINDPRLKAYSDSLTTYNNRELLVLEAKRNIPTINYREYPKFLEDIHKKYPYNTKLSDKIPESEKKVVATTKDKQDIYNGYRVKFPKQPYVYIAPIGIQPTEPQLTQDTLQAPNIPVNTNKSQRDFYQAAQQLAYQGQPVGRVNDGDSWTELSADEWNKLYGTKLETKKKMNNGGYISPYAEMGFNTDNPSKGSPNVMSAGENVGWTIADIITSPVSSFTGKNLSEMASKKVNPYNRKQGSWWGGVEATYVKPMVQSGLADSGIPFVSQVAGMGKGIRENVAPALINEDDDPNRLAIQSGMGAAGSSIGGGISSFGGSKMMKMGGKLLYNNGGMIDGMGLNELSGPSHEEGGMTISPQTEVEGKETVLESKNYVFSDSILVPNKKSSFAKESKLIKNKYKLRPDDKLSKESMKSELDNLMNKQEEVKNSMMMADQERFTKKMKKKYGGLLLDRNNQPIQMWSGGTIGETPINPITGNPYNMNVNYSQPNSNLDINVMSANKYYNTQDITSLDDEGQTSAVLETDSYPVLASQVYQPNSKFSGLQTPNSVNLPISDAYSNVIPPSAIDLKPVTDSAKNDNQFDPNSLKIPNSAIAALAAGLKGSGRQKLRLTPRMKFNYLNTRPAEVLAERAGEMGMAAGLNTLKDNAVTSGNFIANAVNLAGNTGANTGKNVAELRFQGDVNNLGIANQEALAVQGLARENNTLSTQYDTANLLKRDKVLDDMSRVSQSQNLDDEKKKQQTMLLELMSQGIVKWNPKGGGYLIKSEDESGEVKWVPYKTLMG